MPRDSPATGPAPRPNQRQPPPAPGPAPDRTGANRRLRPDRRQLPPAPGPAPATAWSDGTIRIGSAERGNAANPGVDRVSEHAMAPADRLSR